MFALLGIAVIIGIFVVVTVCRVLAASVREVTKWDRRNGEYDK